jgi:hypothetical protein
MREVAKGFGAVVLLIVIALAVAFLAPLLIHLLIELPQRGWEMVA